MKAFFLTVFPVVIAVLFFAGAPAYTASAPGGTASAPGGKEEVQVEPVGNIDYKNGLLSAKIDNLTLGDVINQIARKAGFVVDVNPAVSGRKITTEFQNVGLEDALRRIIHLTGNINYRLDYNSNGDVASMRVYEEGKAASVMQPVTAVQPRGRRGVAPAPPQSSIPQELLRDENVGEPQ